MTFDDHWKKVLSFNPALAENPFLRPLAEAAWNAAAVVEREACAKVCEDFEDEQWQKHDAATNEKTEAKADGAAVCADRIRMRSNVAIEGPEQAQLANGPARMEGSAS